MNRYARTQILAGKYLGTSRVERRIYDAVRAKNIDVTVVTMKQGERLDTLAGRMYANSTYWWIIAAASGIGWGSQVPPGTVVYVPTNLDQVASVVV